jgi:hypothetical protein
MEERAEFLQDLLFRELALDVHPFGQDLTIEGIV